MMHKTAVLPQINSPESPCLFRDTMYACPRVPVTHLQQLGVIPQKTGVLAAARNLLAALLPKRWSLFDHRFEWR